MRIRSSFDAMSFITEVKVHRIGKINSDETSVSQTDNYASIFTDLYQMDQLEILS